MAKCERLHAALLNGPVCKCDQLRLLDKNRRTRNLAASAWRCEHSAPPSRFFQRDYSSRHERPHFILKNAVDRTRLSRGVLQAPQLPQSLLARIPYESRQSKGCMSRNVTLRRAVVAAIDEASPDPFDSVHRFVLHVLSEIPLILRAPRLSREFSFEIFVAQEGVESGDVHAREARSTIRFSR
jgi:hypothetical protein